MAARYSIYLLSLLLIMLGVSGQSLYAQSLKCEIDSASPRKIVSNTMDITGLWAAEFEIDPTRSNTMLTYTNQLIIAKTCNEIISLDLGTGGINWRSNGMTNPTDLTLDENNEIVYVVGQQEVQALDLFSGESIWSNISDLFARTAISTHLLSDGRLVVHPVGRGMYYLDLKDGSLKDRIDLPTGTRLFDGDWIVSTSVDKIKVMDAETQSEIWIYDELSGIWTIDLFAADNLLIVRGYDSQPLQGLSAINLSSGEVLWRWGEARLASNPIIQDTILYFLTTDAELVMLNAMSGIRLHSVQFDKPSASGEFIQNSQIVVTDDALVVYFQDKNSLSIYDISHQKNS